MHKCSHDVCRDVQHRVFSLITSNTVKHEIKYKRGFAPLSNAFFDTFFFRADKQVASGECMQKGIHIPFLKSYLSCTILIEIEYSTIFFVVEFSVIKIYSLPFDSTVG